MEQALAIAAVLFKGRLCSHSPTVWTLKASGWFVAHGDRFLLFKAWSGSEWPNINTAKHPQRHTLWQPQPMHTDVRYQHLVCTTALLYKPSLGSEVLRLEDLLWKTHSLRCTRGRLYEVACCGKAPAACDRQDHSSRYTVQGHVRYRSATQAPQRVM